MTANTSTPMLNSPYSQASSVKPMKKASAAQPSGPPAMPSRLASRGWNQASASSQTPKTARYMCGEAPVTAEAGGGDGSSPIPDSGAMGNETTQARAALVWDALTCG